MTTSRSPGKLWVVSSVRPRVLIVEDEAGVRDALARGLARNGSIPLLSPQPRTRYAVRITTSH